MALHTSSVPYGGKRVENKHFFKENGKMFVEDSKYKNISAIR